MRDKVSGARRWVVKIGSALLTADGRGLDQAAMAVWVDQMVALREAGVELVLVSSGAVAAGMSRLGWSARPRAVHELQAAAAVGQMGLIRAWETSFARCEQQTAQILVTHDDLSDRKRYPNARDQMLSALLNTEQYGLWDLSAQQWEMDYGYRPAVTKGVVAETLCEEDVTVLDKLLHMTEEERQKKYSDV